MENQMNLLEMTPPEISRFLVSLGEPPYRTGQILDWLYKKEAISFAEMTNLPLGLREKLSGRIKTGFLHKTAEQISRDGTVKFLFTLSDGQGVETVMLPYENGFSICVSTQVGCRMGCCFCASGLPGLVRNLTSAEIMAQVLQVKKILQQQGKSLRSLVLMGSGEPLDNWSATISFLQAVRDPERLRMGLRHVTLSTCGLVPRIRELAALQWPLTLAVSLHAPGDILRNRIMPINRKYPLHELMAACDEFAEATGRRVTFEYILIHQLNDSEVQARALARLLRGRLCHVNLITLNNVPGLSLKPAAESVASRFQVILQANRIQVTIRRKLGADIAAACGQLRNSLLPTCQNTEEDHSEE